MIRTGDSLGSIYNSNIDSPSKISSQSPGRLQESRLSNIKVKQPINKNLKMMSLKKMVGGAAHKRVCPQSGINDELDTNVRDFKKLFNKIRIQSNASNNVMNSPYYQMKYNFNVD